MRLARQAGRNNLLIEIIMARNKGQSAKPDNKGLRSTVGKALASARRAFFGVGIFSFFINLLMLTGPIYMLQVYDRVLVSRSISTLLALSILMGAMYLFMGILEFLRSRVLVRVANKFEEDLGERTFDIWMKQGLYGKGAARHAPLQDLATIRTFMSGNAPGTFFDIPWAPIYIGVIFILHWTLGLVGVFGALVVLIAALYNELATKKPLVESIKLRRQEQDFSQQSYRNADAITAMGMGSNVRSRWASINKQGSQEFEKSSDKAGGSSAFTKAFRMFVQSAILGLGGALAVKQIITPGAMIAASIILGRAMAPIQMVIGQWRGFAAARDAYNRLNVFYDMIPEDEQSLKLPEPKGHLTVHNMTAGPPGAHTAVLTGINFELKPGDGLGVIGPSAAGKSTLARLLVGIWLPQKGDIRIDGATFDQWDHDAIGPYIGYLPQEVELIDGTIGENISRFRPDATPEAIVKAAQEAGVHEMILHLDDGYDTRVGEGGAVLSGGQVQRVALARALYGDPVLLVLDEPNSNLDADGDAALTRAMANARKRGATVVVMAHRPSAIVAVDKLLMLREGRQVAFGPKEDVLAEVQGKAKQARAQQGAQQGAKP